METQKKSIVVLASYHKILKTLVNFGIQQVVKNRKGEEVDNDVTETPSGMVQINHPCQKILNCDERTKRTTVLYVLRFLVEKQVIFKVGESRNITTVKFDPKVLNQWEIETRKALPRQSKPKEEEPKKEKEAPVEEKVEEKKFSLADIRSELGNLKTEIRKLQLRLKALEQEEVDIQDKLKRMEIRLTRLSMAEEIFQSLCDL